MTRDFWMGVLALPAAAVSLALVFSAVVLVIAVSERVDFTTWKLWPKNAGTRNRDTLAATVACARSVRYFWIPGWHVVVCRTRLATRMTPEQDARWSRVRTATAQALPDPPDTGADAGCRE